MAGRTYAETICSNMGIGRARPIELDALEIYTASRRCRRWADMTPSEASKSAPVSVKSASSRRWCRLADITPSEDINSTGFASRRRWADMTPSDANTSPSASVRLAAAALATVSLGATSMRLFARRPDLADTLDDGQASYIYPNSVSLSPVQAARATLSSAFDAISVAAAASLGLCSWRAAGTGRHRRKYRSDDCNKTPRQTTVTFSETVKSPSMRATEVGSSPSKGSYLHQSGECKRCAWFWKQQGCIDGAECNYCHLCPEVSRSAVKKRKAQKAIATATANKPEISAAGRAPARVTANKPEISATSPAPISRSGSQSSKGVACALAVDLTSKGSELHGTGACKPCSWFWKPVGCRSESECLHCHLCPADEQERRKKAKRLAIRSHEKRPCGDARRSFGQSF